MIASYNLTFTKGWKTEEDEFICVYGVKLPFLDSNTFFAPKARPDDGVIWLLIIRKEASKVSKLLKNACKEDKINNG